jgi:hypothetical protein
VEVVVVDVGDSRPRDNDNKEGMMHRFTVIVLAAATALLLQLPIRAATPDGKAFPSADAAAQALVTAAKNRDTAGLIEILGPSAKSILTTHDAVADRNAIRDFAARAAQKMTLEPSHGKQNARTLLVGKDKWPLPIPIVEANGQWYFDTAQGKEEILNRRIGSNELDAIEVCRGFVEAENDYATKNRGANNVPVYAQKIISTPGQHDGLYWASSGEGDESPIGEFVAKAIAQGYTNKHDPYQGYYFKVLTAQGPNASGGEMGYVDNGQMTKGFAFIAWPSNYGSTGIMTFLVDRTGIVYQKDLGKKTAEIAGAYSAYDPDKTWIPVKDSKRP